jgi:hypothetical protein
VLAVFGQRADSLKNKSIASNSVFLVGFNFKLD